MQFKLLIFMLIINSATSWSQEHPQIFNPQKMKYYESQLLDVMELVDTTLILNKLNDAEKSLTNDTNEINILRLGIIYHEVALNLSFLSNSKYKGYAQKCFNLLQNVINKQLISNELMPFATAYSASALSLVAAETKKLNLISKSFKMFEVSIENYAQYSYLPEFLRGSVAENLPWIFWNKKKFAKTDFQSIIKKYELDHNYANPKIMSFCYWAWANQHKSKKDQAIKYLDLSIALDPNYLAARSKAEKLKHVLLSK